MLEALATLQPDQRAALVLVDLQGHSVEEAASILGVASGTVKSRCSRGRARLAPLLADLRPGVDTASVGGNPVTTSRVPPATTPPPGEGGPAPPAPARA